MSDFSSTKDWYTRVLANTAWDRYSVAIEHPYVYADATEITIGYIKEGFAYIGKANVAAINVIYGLVKMSAALDISVAYDARWYLGADKKYHMYTLGNAYIAYIDTNHNLYIRNGTEGVNRLLASGVDKCFVVRGWKQMSEIDQDQGLCVFYVKNGALYSRRYIQKDTQLYEWEIETQYTLAKSIVDLQAYRTADFRLSICTQNLDGTNSLVITDRVFPGQSIPSETIQVQAAMSVLIEPKPVTIRRINSSEALYIKSDTPASLPYTHIVTNDNTFARSVLGDTILLSLTAYIPVGSYMQFLNNVSVTDDNNNVYSIISLSYEGMWLKMNMSDFNNAIGKITITYTSGITDDLGWAIPAFNCNFTPVGLVPTPPDPPIPQSAINVNSEVIQ